VSNMNKDVVEYDEIEIEADMVILRKDGEEVDGLSIVDSIEEYLQMIGPKWNKEYKKVSNNS